MKKNTSKYAKIEIPKIERKEIIEKLRCVSFLEEISIKWFDFMLEHGSVIRSDKSNIIISERDPDTDVFFILEGKIRVSKTTPDGREVILCILSEGDFFGEISAIDNLKRTATVKALTKTTMFSLKSEFFNKILEQEPTATLSLLKEVASRLRKTDEQIKTIWLSGAIGKVSNALLMLSEDFGIVKKSDIELSAIVTQQNIASYSAITRETCSRVLSFLEKEGFIKKNNRVITILNYEYFRKKFTNS